MIKFFTSFFFCLVCFFSLAQEKISQLEELEKASLAKYDISNFTDSKKIALQLLEESYKEQATYYTASAYNLLALNDEAVENYSSAKEKYTKSKDLSLLHNYPRLLMVNYNGLGNVWVLEEKNYKVSEIYYKKALHIADSLNHSFKNDVLINIVWNRLDNNQPQKTADYIGELKKITTNVDKEFSSYNSTLISSAYLLLARYYAQINQHELAEVNFDKSIEVLETHPLYEQLSEIYLYRSSYEKSIGKFDKAFFYLEKHISNKNNFINEDLKKRLAVENARYDLKEYERALVSSKREKVLMQDLAKSKSRTSWLYAIISIFLFAILLLIYRENKIKNKLIITLNKRNKQLKKAKKDAEIAAEAKSQFISNISHEIRTPLHGVIGIASLLLESDDTSNTNKKLLNSLKFSGNYLLNLINNILFLNKIDKNKIKVKPEVITLHTFLNNISNAVQFHKEKYNCEVVYKIDPKLPSQIISDSNILYEVLLNLTDNAIKFSKGKVRVEVNQINHTQDKSIIEFKVIDDGVGIPKDKQNIIFDNFSQISIDKSIMEGTGIGLSIVRKLLLLMNSEIKLNSKVDQGSIFSFEIECDNPLKQNVVQDQSFKINPLKEKKIIQVEDNQINRLVVEKFLKDYDVDLNTFGDGQDGLEALIEKEWDIALVDINIPTLNGYEIVTSVRKIHPTKPIIAVTASELSEIKERAVKAGITDVLIKPFSKETLINTISKYLQ